MSNKELAVVAVGALGVAVALFLFKKNETIKGLEQPTFSNREPTSADKLSLASIEQYQQAGIPLSLGGVYEPKGFTGENPTDPYRIYIMSDEQKAAEKTVNGQVMKEAYVLDNGDIYYPPSDATEADVLKVLQAGMLSTGAPTTTEKQYKDDAAFIAALADGQIAVGQTVYY